MQPSTTSNSAVIPGQMSRARKAILRVVLLFALFGCGGIVLFVGFQRSLIYAPRQGAVSRPDTLLPGTSLLDVVVTSADGVQLHGWLSQRNEIHPDQQRKLVILFPGNAGNRSFRTAIMKDFNACGWDCLICDYRGYGENEGRPSESAFAQDAQAIWTFATGQLGYNWQQVVLCGESLGGGVATRLAWDLCRAQTPPAGLILRTTFTSLVDTGRSLFPWLPVKTFLVDRYPSIDRLPEITCPVLVIHGELDEIVPYEQGERLFAAAPDRSASGVEKTFLRLPESGHNDLQQTAAEELHQAHQHFLESLIGPAEGTEGAPTP